MQLQQGVLFEMIYLDNAASTRTDGAVVKAMIPFFSEIYGNASSMHEMGQSANDAMEKSREIIAKSIGANPGEIIFTSGGTESNNFAIKAIAFSNKEKNHIITSKAEHDCVLNSASGWKSRDSASLT